MMKHLRYTIYFRVHFFFFLVSNFISTHTALTATASGGHFFPYLQEGNEERVTNKERDVFQD